MNSTHADINAKIALLFTHAQSHTHTLAFITLAGKKRGERRVELNVQLDREKLCAPKKKMLLHTSMQFFIHFY